MFTPCPSWLAGLHGWWFLGAGPVDDDYICYRYARNLAEGLGLVFNAGERVEGYTTPLWVFLHAAWQGLGGDSPRLAVGAGIGAFVLSVAALVGFDRRRGAFPAAAFVLSACPAMAWHSVAGLGTTLFGLFLLSALLCGARRPLVMGLCLAAACAMRQEAVLFVLPLMLWLRGGARTRAVAPALLVLAGWTAFRWFYYGRLLPMTYSAKKLPVAEDLAYGWRYFVDASGNLFWPLWLALAGWAAWRKQGPQQPVWRAFALGAALHSAYVVWVGGDFMVLSRFFVPVLPVLLLMAWEPCFQKPLSAAQRRRSLAPWGAALACMVLMQWNQFEPHEESRSTRQLIQQGFKQRWLRLGEHFGAHFPKQTKVALSPIGAFGWASNLHVVDILGLTNQSVVGDKPDTDFVKVKGHHRSDFDWVLDQNPEFVILGNGVRDQAGNFTICPWERGFYQSLQQGGRFPKTYRQASMDIGDGMPLDVFIRRDQPLPPQTRWVAP